ncbi:NAD(P)-binding protein [Tothia fuscella]|uniref:NAD(P)-binding protein n=1 Tax=Tothia fuscella TaxID=1048955 RepID=A0A9P4NGY4_9PEZI|nr:NAD(P)-binding protein [Tothia fuscella]
MVSLSLIKKSNATIPDHLPPSLVAIFVGGTSGIGEATLKLFTKSTSKPHIYIIGRSLSSAERIIAECRTLNPSGNYEFCQKDMTSMGDTRRLCDEIRSKEKVVNLLILSAGDPDLSRTKTSEGLHRLFAAQYYSRILLMTQLLPLLLNAESLSRIVNVSTGGGSEGAIDTSDMQALTLPMMQLRGHASTMLSLSLNRIAQENPTVAFITQHPGTVATPALGRMTGIFGVVIRFLTSILGWAFAVPIDESAERHLYLATSSAYPPREGSAKGVPMVGGLEELHEGVDGEVGSGCYSLGWNGEGPGRKAVELLEGYGRDGTGDAVWEHTMGEFERIQREDR